MGTSASFWGVSPKFEKSEYLVTDGNLGMEARTLLSQVQSTGACAPRWVGLDSRSPLRSLGQTSYSDVSTRSGFPRSGPVVLGAHWGLFLPDSQAHEGSGDKVIHPHRGRTQLGARPRLDIWNAFCQHRDSH